MITFWIIATSMVVFAMFILLRPLLFNLDKSDIDRTVLNADIAKERLNELKLDLEQGVINEEEYNLTREELEQSLLYDVAQEQDENSSTVSTNSYNRILRTVLIISIPAVAISFYVFLGSPELMDGGTKQATTTAAHAATGEGKLASIEDMIDKLAEKVKENPDNAKGWFMLGRSYMSLKRYKEAAAALEKTNQLVPNNPVIMLQYADALTMSRGGEISGKPFALIKKVVEIKPDSQTGLWLLGMGYDEQGEYLKAISSWTLLLPLLNDDTSTGEVKNLIRQAKIKLGIDVAEESVLDSKTANTQAEKKSIISLRVSVSIDKKLLKNVSMNDTVFIFAKAINGPPMPLAVVRKQVKDLPLEVLLDDSMAMMPSMKLSAFDQVQITARIAKTGNPIKQPDDLYSKAIQVQLPFSGTVNIKINLIVE